MFDLRKRLDNDNVGWKFIMDKKRGLLNIGVSIIFKILLLLGSILVRRFLIQYIGNEANGLSSLLSLIHISEPTRLRRSRMPSSA